MHIAYIFFIKKIICVTNQQELFYHFLRPPIGDYRVEARIWLNVEGAHIFLREKERAYDLSPLIFRKLSGKFI